MTYCYIHRAEHQHSSSKNLLSPVVGDEHKDPQPNHVQRVRDIKALINQWDAFIDCFLHDSTILSEEEAEILQESEVVNDSKETVSSDSRSAVHMNSQRL